MREGMGQATGMPDSETLDCIITNALIIDWQGIYKVRPDVLSFFDFKRSRALTCSPNRVHKTQADIGIKNHRISAIGKGGNPDVMDGITPGMIVGVNTEVIGGEKLIVTYGAFDAHGTLVFSDTRLRSITRSSSSYPKTESFAVCLPSLCDGAIDKSTVHYTCPQICEEALASGIVRSRPCSERWHSHNAYLISPKLFSILTTLTDYSARWRYRTLVRLQSDYLHAWADQHQDHDGCDGRDRTQLCFHRQRERLGSCRPCRSDSRRSGRSQSPRGSSRNALPALSQKNPSFADPCLPRTVRIGVRRRPRSTTALPWPTSTTSRSTCIRTPTTRWAMSMIRLPLSTTASSRATTPKGQGKRHLLVADVYPRQCGALILLLTTGRGGHAPDILVVSEYENVLPSSTNPTRPYAQNTLDEHLDVRPFSRSALSGMSKV